MDDSDVQSRIIELPTLKANRAFDNDHFQPKKPAFHQPACSEHSKRSNHESEYSSLDTCSHLVRSCVGLN